GSLAIDGIYRMMRDIRNLDKSMGVEDIHIEPSVKVAREKLERSLAAKRDMKVGEIITEEDLHLLSPGNGFKWNERHLLIGKTMNTMVPKDEIIYREYVN